MKQLKTFCLGLLVMLTGTGAFAGNGNENENSVEVTYTSYSVKELKVMFGDNLILVGELASLDENTQVKLARAANPCDAFPDFELCGPVGAQAGQAAQAYANACCCDVIYGWECCNPGTGSAVSYLAIASPNPGQCR